jgi:hypothetical protein
MHIDSMVGLMSPHPQNIALLKFVSEDDGFIFRYVTMTLL